MATNMIEEPTLTIIPSDEELDARIDAAIERAEKELADGVKPIPLAEARARFTKKYGI